MLPSSFLRAGKKERGRTQQHLLKTEGFWFLEGEKRIAETGGMTGGCVSGMEFDQSTRRKKVKRDYPAFFGESIITATSPPSLTPRSWHQSPITPLPSLPPKTTSNANRPFPSSFYAREL